MALADVIQAGTTTHTYTGGTGANSIDGDFATAQLVLGEGLNGSATSTVISTHTFTSARNIKKITYKVRSAVGITGNAPLSSSQSETIECLAGGTWTTIYSYSFNLGGQGSNDHNTGVANYTTQVDSVTSVRVTVTATASAADGGYSANVYIYEIQAYYTIKKSYAGIV